MKLDNDKSGANCALNGHHDHNAGGWWYRACSEFHPNHQYNSNYSMFLSPQWYALPFIEIKIKQSDCSV